MAKKGLVFLMNQYPNDQSEKFLHKKIFRFIPTFTNVSTTIIELEIHENNICVISFYDDNRGAKKDKYKMRANLGAGHTKAIFKACLEAFGTLNEDYALVFSSANDLGKVEEYNARYSAYLFFLSLYFKDFDNYIQQGSIALSTLMLYHQSFQYKDEADKFYFEFERKVEEEISNDDAK